MFGKTLAELQVGDRGEVVKKITESDIFAFAGITGDFNQMHINKRLARKSAFGGQIAHGVLTLGMVSTVIGTLLPGPGTILTGIDKLKFLYPVRPGDTIQAVVEVFKVIPDHYQVLLQAKCLNQFNEIVLTCECSAKPPQRSLVYYLNTENLLSSKLA